MDDNDDRVTTLIFDVDDTLYDVSTGFTAERNGRGAQRFMVKYLNFPNEASAKKLRDEYFEKYHATAKALQVAEAEGRLPPPDPNKPAKKPRFDPNDLAEFWATSLNFDLLGGERKSLIRDLQECRLQLVAFSNGPRKYVVRVLKELGLWGTVFTEDRLFAVDDTLPYCKPEREAFEKIFARLGVRPHECIMIEDSMKNVRRAKELGMKTVLITGTQENAAESEATKPGDAPVHDDPAVDISLQKVEDMRTRIPGLWGPKPVFETVEKPLRQK
jgi:putative hydrolase of the HAD superfamily